MVLSYIISLSIFEIFYEDNYLGNLRNYLTILTRISAHPSGSDFNYFNIED